MGKKLQPNTAVLIGPRWQPGTVLYTDDAGVHVMAEDGDYATHSSAVLAVRGAKPKRRDEVLIEAGGGWERATVLDLSRGRARVAPGGDEQRAHWVELESLAVLASHTDKQAANSGSTQSQESFGIRSQRWGWTYGGLMVLGVGALAPVFGLVGLIEGGRGWAIALTWLALHGILAAYVTVQNRTLPRFHPAGFGKPDDPGFDKAGAVLERPPMRGKWELALALIVGWVIVGVGPFFPGYSPWVPPIYVSLLGVGSALLSYFHDRASALDARRLLGAKPFRDATDTSEGRLLGTVVGERGKQPAMWREVVLVTWSESRQVTKSVTDSNGNVQSVQATETTHYSCGLRRERDREQLRLDTPLGAVDVPLRGLVWAAERDLSFGRGGGKSRGWRPPRPAGEAMADHTRAAVLERIYEGERVVVLGELRRDGAEGGRIVGGKNGPAVLFAAGDRDPTTTLRRELLRRRALLAAMILLGLATLATV